MSHDLLLDERRPLPLPKIQMAPILRFIMSPGYKKKEPRCACLSEAKASYAQKMWNEVSSSVPHFLQMGLLFNPITYKCLLRLLCPVRRPITILDCVLLKDSNRVFNQVRARNQFSSPSLCVTRTTPQYQTLVIHPGFYLSSYVLPRDLRGRLRPNKLLNRTVSCELVGDFISS